MKPSRPFLKGLVLRDSSSSIQNKHENNKDDDAHCIEGDNMRNKVEVFE